MDPDGLDRLAAIVQAECDSLQNEYGHGTLKDFRQTAGRGLTTERGLSAAGAWASGEALREVHAQLYDYTQGFYTQLVQQLAAAAGALRAAAERYRQADDTTAAAAVGTGMVMHGEMNPAPTTARPAHGSGSTASDETADFEGLG